MSADARPVSPPPDDPNLDLGFGAVVARESRKRLLNRDGTFNARRDGLGFWQSLSAYHYFLSISWPRFLAFVVAAFAATNALFSVHTLATIGYGNIVPVTFAANALVAVESLVGLLGVAIVAGIMFARFSRPIAQVLFSRNAIIAPYRGKRALMFRIANQKRNEMVELEAKVLLARRQKGGGNALDREFVPLKLERDRVVFFPLAWTVVHPIDEFSPLRGCSPDDLRAVDAEVLILLNGFDETFSQTVHTRSSYKADEIVWGAKFRNMFNPLDDDGVISIDIRKLHEIDRVEL
jgi:inward rectifier potassium channel